MKPCQLLAAHDFGRIDPARGVPGVNDKECLVDNSAVVIAGVISDDDDGIILVQIVEWRVG